MKSRNFTAVYVIDPHTKERIPAKEWLEQSKDPAMAKWVVIENKTYGFAFGLFKEELADSLNYPDSVAKVEEFILPGCRLGTRIEWVTIYNAVHTAGLNDILEAIGGDPIERKWYWTEEMDEDQSYAADAWGYFGAGGFLYTSSARFSSYASRVLRALQAVL